MFSKIPLTIADLRGIEEYFELSLPVEYKQLQLSHHGARPEKKRFKTGTQKERVLKTFLPVTKDYETNTFAVIEWLGLSKGTIPFASTPSGDYLCFRYENQQEPMIVLYHHEIKSYEHVATSFKEFITSLY